MSIFFNNVRFFKSVKCIFDLPVELYPEISFLGRSNSGKSNVINSICFRKNLSYVGCKPGCTKYINYFSVLNKNSIMANFVDMPGYGYTKYSRRFKNLWKILLNYLNFRIQLKGVILVMDSRNPFTKLDYFIINNFLRKLKPIHILLSKCDKLSNNDRNNVLNTSYNIINEYFINNYSNNITIQLFSSNKKIGIKELCVLIRNWIFF